MFRLVLLLLIFTQFNLAEIFTVNLNKGVNNGNYLYNWKKPEILLQPTERKPARTAVLILDFPAFEKRFHSKYRWKIGRKVWEQHMNSHPNVDCYFLECTNLDPNRDSSNQVWLKGNTIYVGLWWYEKYKKDSLLEKTMLAMEWLVEKRKYTHFIRTDLNVFFNLKNVNEYSETHSQSFYTAPLWQTAWYTIGYGIMFTADVAEHMVSEYKRLKKRGEKLIEPTHADDGALTSLATGIWPYDKDHPFRCCPTLPLGLRQLMCKESFDTKRLCKYGLLLDQVGSLEEALEYADKAIDNVMLYRIYRGFTLQDLAHLYGFLLRRVYPELSCIDLVEYVTALEEENKRSITTP